MNPIEQGSVVLDPNGDITAVWRRPKDDCANRHRFSPSLNIMVAAVVDEGVYRPATSIMLYRVETIRALRQACDEALKGYES